MTFSDQSNIDQGAMDEGVTVVCPKCGKVVEYSIGPVMCVGDVRGWHVPTMMRRAVAETSSASLRDPSSAYIRLEGGLTIMSQSDRLAPPMAIGARDLPGVAKMAEEAGELAQVVGKLLATDGAAEHWDGTNLHVRLVEESGDLLAAIRYFAEANGSTADVEARASIKLALFRRWHDDEAARDCPGGAR